MALTPEAGLAVGELAVLRGAPGLVVGYEKPLQ
jgi:hypothetical protein